MRLLIENELLKVEVKTKGAELCSLINKQSGIEHMWQADENVWGKHSPILFPIVGQVVNGLYRLGEEKYELSRHGFARDMEFSVASHTDESLIFELRSTEDTLKVYPFKFTLQVRYTLLNDKLNVEYFVKNDDNKTMWFSIGGHPAFAVPFIEKENLTDYYLEFCKDESADRISLSNGGFLKEKVDSDFFNYSNIIRLNVNTFNDDAIVLHNLSSEKITIKSDKNNNQLEFDFKGYPYFGIWSKPGANFVCLEPWHGVTDYENFSGELKDKAGICKIEKSNSFSCNYEIKVK